jgi:hypothetical protein
MHIAMVLSAAWGCETPASVNEDGRVRENDPLAREH